MGISSFPGGFQNGVLIRGVPIQVTHPGEIFYVNNTSVLVEGGIGGSDINNGTYLQPFATINHAISKCKASRGDMIMVMPGHEETITTAGGIDLNVEGVAIIGLGTYNLRPKIIINTITSADVTVTAANCLIYNIVFEAALADLTSAIDVVAVGCTLSHLHFQEQGASLNFKEFISCISTTDNTADGLYVSYCTGYGVDDKLDSAIVTLATITDLVVEHCHFNLDNTAALAMIALATTKFLTGCRITNNHYQSLKTTGDILVDSDSGNNNGVIAYNTSFHLDAFDEVNIDCTGAGLFENYASGVVDVQGYLTPAADG